ncbi:MAG: acylneuraminate cytidylyltransferase family protein [Lentisphaeria bacterium]|nr:acylneuraminate cytidylyltransferase family protein [Candidatus Neomarinimicrobiota bacterium]MCF7842035.1 acylneuraminate cytidylyltransferase family protein [Lentisphaeria bacterium]
MTLENPSVKTIAIIPARGGSKGIPGKNIKLFNGKPLIAWSITYALSAGHVDQVLVSTEDDEIAAVAREFGAGVIPRPELLAGDTASTESAISHALEWLEGQGVQPEKVVLLQATSPLRPENSLDEAITHFDKGGFDSLLSLSPTHRFFWRTRGDIAEAEYDFLRRPRRQDMQLDEIRYVENGSLYIFTRQHFLKIGNRLGGKIGYVVFPEWYSMEIDTPLDFEILERMAKSNQVNHK